MEAPPSPSESARELAELRSRAYGPDADIDAESLERLFELESMVRADATGDAGAGDQPTAHTEPESTPQSVPGPVATSAIVIDDTPGAAADAPPPSRPRWWRRVPLWGYVGGAAAVGLIAGLAVPALLPPHPTATLRPAPIGDAPLEFEMYGIDAESPVRYEPFYGLEVWSAETQQGSTCIVVTNARSEWMGAGCAPEPLIPMADITFFASMRPIDGLELPDGSIARFIMSGDVIEVWIAETAAPA